MVDWVVSHRVDESCYVGSLIRKGADLGGHEVLLPHFAFKALCHPYVTCLRDVEGGWIACQWSDLMQLATRGSAMSECAF